MDKVPVQVFALLSANAKVLVPPPRVMLAEALKVSAPRVWM